MDGKRPLREKLYSRSEIFFRALECVRIAVCTKEYLFHDVQVYNSDRSAGGETMKYIRWLLRRILIWGRRQKRVRTFYRYFRLDTRGKRIDRSFSRPDDVDLTADEVRQINEFWSRYKFAYPEIDYESFKIFKNRVGFSPLHLPPGICSVFLRPNLVDPNYKISFQNKGMLARLYPDIRQPVTVVRRMNGAYYDEKYHKISLKKVLLICSQAIASGQELILKPSGMGGGRGIQFMNNSDIEAIHEAIRDIGNTAFVIQHVMKQSPSMARFHAGSVNTMRITSLFHKGDVHILAALVRVGSGQNRVDNWCAGGSLVGIDIRTGQCLPWALMQDNSRVSVLPSGLDLAAEPVIVPNFRKACEVVRNAHYSNPYVKLISWDIALDESNEPVMIEANFAGMLQIHEATTGPVFGEHLKMLLDKYMQDEFFHRRATLNFNYQEYHDHIVITRYAGLGKNVRIPAAILGKPVTTLSAGCFPTGKTIRVSIPENVSFSQEGQSNLIIKKYKGSSRWDVQ